MEPAEDKKQNNGAEEEVKRDVKPDGDADSTELMKPKHTYSLFFLTKSYLNTNLARSHKEKTILKIAKSIFSGILSLSLEFILISRLKRYYCSLLNIYFMRKITERTAS